MFFSTNLDIFNDFFDSKSGKIFSLRVHDLKIQETNFAKNSTRFIFKRIILESLDLRLSLTRKLRYICLTSIN